MDEGIYESKHTFTFTEKHWWDHIAEYLGYLSRQVPTFLSICASIWVASEVISAAAENRIPPIYLGTLTLALGLIVAASRAYVLYSTRVPQPLKSECNQTIVIYRKQKSGWQFSLARKMLTNRIQDQENEIDRIYEGVAFIQPKQFDKRQYADWLILRPTTLTRLLRAVSLSCTKFIPEKLTNITSTHDLDALKKEINRLDELYSIAKSFEAECYSVIPPENLQHIHETTHNWTKPIRDGVSELADILKEISHIDKKDIKANSVGVRGFQITFDTPEIVYEFNRRMKQLNATSEQTAKPIS